MTAMETARTLSLPRHTVDALDAISLPEMLPGYEDFLRDPEVLEPFFERDNGLTILKIFLEWVPLMQAKYQDLGIPDEIFRDNLRDIPIWVEDYWDKHHAPGFAQWGWVANSMRLKIFRLGRLQFEPAVLEEALPWGALPGTPFLDVHIPAGEPLDADAVADSFARAPGFFETCFGSRFPFFHCHSWLLSPRLKALLPPGSRILQFQDFFTVYFEDTERQAEERVFGALSEDPAAYPEATTLQAALKQALLAGNTPGMGKGYRMIAAQAEGSL